TRRKFVRPEGGQLSRPPCGFPGCALPRLWRDCARHAHSPWRVRSPKETVQMTIEKIQPNSLFKRNVSGHLLYSHLVVASGEKLVFVSGQLARDKDGNIVGPRDMRAQIKQVGENIKSALEAAGATLNDLVKTTTFVTDIDEFFKHVDVRHNYLGVGLPASTTVEVRRLSHPDLVVEIEAMAVLKG